MLVEPKRSPALEAIQLIVIVTALMWLIEAADTFVFNHSLDQQGIIPRSWGGLDGIIWAPWLHGSFGHLLGNTFPFLVLGGFVALDGIRRWVSVTLFVMILGGLAVWLLGSSGSHIGASGLIFGYGGFLLVAGFVERSMKGVAVTVVIGVLFGGLLIRGIFPAPSWVSWESHLFGLVSGVLAAFVIADPDRAKTSSSGVADA
jgi:membrane associated rhomboid family serine protease